MNDHSNFREVRCKSCRKPIGFVDRDASAGLQRETDGSHIAYCLKCLDSGGIANYSDYFELRCGACDRPLGYLYKSSDIGTLLPICLRCVDSRESPSKPVAGPYEYVCYECGKVEKSEVPLGGPMICDECYAKNPEAYDPPKGVPLTGGTSGAKVGSGPVFSNRVAEEYFLDNCLERVGEKAQVKALFDEVKDLRDQLEVKDIDLRKLKDAIAYKDDEITRRELGVQKKEAHLEKGWSKLKAAKAAVPCAPSVSDACVARPPSDSEPELPEKVKTGNERFDDLLYGGIPAGKQVLVMGPPFIGKETFVNNFIVEGLQHGVPCLVLTTDCSPSDILDELRYIMEDRVPDAVDRYLEDGQLQFIDAYSKAMGMDNSTDPNITVVDHPTDYKGINKAIDKFSEEFKDQHRTWRMAVRSISCLVTLSDPTTTYRFLQNRTGRSKRDKVVVLYLLDKGMHNEQEIQTLGHLMDGAVEFKTDGVKTFLAIQGICDVQSRMWVQYQYSKRGLNIGSFTLDHINSVIDNKE